MNLKRAIVAAAITGVVVLGFHFTYEFFQDWQRQTCGSGEHDLYRTHRQALTYLEDGNRFAENKDWPSAHQQFMQCWKRILKDTNSGIQNNVEKKWSSCCFALIAICLAEQNELTQALAHIDAAILYDRSIGEHYIVRANIYEKLNEPEKARSNFSLASKKANQNVYPAWTNSNRFCFPAKPL